MIEKQDVENFLWELAQRVEGCKKYKALLQEANTGEPMKNDYTYGEKIQVRNAEAQRWVERTYVCHNSKGKVVTENTVGDIALWNHDRPMPEATYVPWTIDDVHLGMKIRSKCWKEKEVTEIIGILSDRIFAGTIPDVTYADLLRYWVTEDGKPCGKLVEEPATPKPLFL